MEGHIKPKIRLMGFWLERVGFKPGKRVRVVSVAPDFRELRSQAVPQLRERCTRLGDAVAAIPT